MTSVNILGAAATLLSGALVGALFSRKSEPDSGRVRELERELEAAKGESYVQHEALGLLKSLFAHNQKIAVEPKTHEWFFGSSLRLGDFIGVVNRDMINAAAVDVEGSAQILHAHSRAFKVPPGKTNAPR